MILQKPKIAIIGAGSGGRAFAAYLAKNRFRVNLIYRTLPKIARIAKTRKILTKGAIHGVYKLNLVTDNYALGLKDVDFILYVVPASAHRSITKAILPYLQQNQVILLNPGRTWGAIEVHNIIRKFNPYIRVLVGETQTLLFTCRAIEDFGVDIIRIKNEVDYCFYPEKLNLILQKFLKRIFPQLNPVSDIRITSLNNIGALVHPTTSILNAGAISRGGNFHFYTDGVTPAISRVIQKVDEERMQIMIALGLKVQSFIEWANKVYGCQQGSYYETFKNILPYQGIKAPQSLQVRYITEDVPTGLVPLASLGKKLGIPTPGINSIINLANILFNFDFINNGRTISNVGLPKRLYRKVILQNDFYDEFLKEPSSFE